MEKLIEIVKNYVTDNHKILIFSSFKTVIDRVKDKFDKENISSYMIFGEVKSKTRMELVDKFNSDDTNCFLITKGTVEERILELRNKKILSDNLIEGKNDSDTLSSLSEKEIKNLLAYGED